MSKRIASIVAVILVIAILSGFAIFYTSQKTAVPPLPTVKAFDVNTFTDPTANFIAVLANLLIEATR